MTLLPLLLAALPPAFAPIASLVGHCWRGTLPDGSVDTHCFRRTGAGVRDAHVVRRDGKAVYRGETDYVVRDAHLRWSYRNAGGPVKAGGVAAVPGGIGFSVDGGPPLSWRWLSRRAYQAETGPKGDAVTFRRIG